ncbi:cytochrome P450 family protein [Pleurotus pulmonarius]
MKTSVTVAALGALLLTVYLKRRSKKRPPLPPGPPADPLIGHLRIMPADKQELVFHEWSKTYGDIMHLRVLGRDLIVLNSVEAATELLEKRSALYSDRPNFTVYVMMGWDPDVAFLPYGPRFRKHRKLLHSHFTQQAIVQFQPIQLQNAHILAKGLLENKGDYHHLLSRYTTAIVMRIAYGHQILSDDDEFIQVANDSGYAQNNGGPPGGTMVDLFPILQYFPSWFPGTHFATFAREWRWAVEKLYTLPYEHVKRQMAQGTAEPSFLATQLEAVAGQTLEKDDIEDLKGSAGIIFGAGAETTWSSLESFILALLLYPEVQKKGQEEIDRVIGSDRLPTFEDYQSLPYVECVTQEILRWHPSVPIGVPHRSTEDDIYRGMFIPKGSIIFANAKGMALDESTYAAPTQFNPDRFLPKSLGGNEEPHLGATFGFGRRICPGRHLATASIWIAVATIFATVNITKAKDEYGNEITPEVDFETGITSRPKQFRCDMTPRSENIVRIVVSECEALSV